MKAKSQTLIERFGFKDSELTTPEHDKILLFCLNPTNMMRILKAIDSRLDPSFNERLSLYHSNPCDFSWKDRCCTGICVPDIEMTDADNGERSPFFYPYKPHPELWAIRMEKLVHERTAKLQELAVQLKDTNDWLSKTLETQLFIEAESPILGHNDYNIGFIDLEVKVRTNPYKTERGEYTCYFMTDKPLRDCQSSVIHYYLEIKPQVKSIGELLRQIQMYKSHLDSGHWIVVTKTKGLKPVLNAQSINVFEIEDKMLMS